MAKKKYSRDVTSVKVVGQNVSRVFYILSYPSPTTKIVLSAVELRVHKLEVYDTPLYCPTQCPTRFYSADYTLEQPDDVTLIR